MIDGVTVRNTGHYNLKTLHIPAKSRLYAMKGAALLFSSFDEILFLDCDNIPARDPSFLFETEAFIETGALFWKDFWMTKPNNPIYPILDLKCVKEQEFESGQMVIKKSFPGVFKALSLAFYMQRNSELYFKFFHGDKDSFRFAWRYFDVPYHQVRYF
jgi:alpha 1,2-mannosyltransferase